MQGLASAGDRAVVLGATNHAQLLDPAVWRRFPYVVNLGLPDLDVRTDLWSYFLTEKVAPPAVTRILASISAGASGADIESLALAARRRAVLSKQEIDLADLAVAVLRLRGDIPLDADGDFRSTIVQLAVKNGATQADVAKMLGVTRQAINAHLRGSERHGTGTKRRRTTGT